HFERIMAAWQGFFLGMRKTRLPSRERRVCLKRQPSQPRCGSSVNKSPCHAGFDACLKVHRSAWAGGMGIALHSLLEEIRRPYSAAQETTAGVCSPGEAEHYPLTCI